jgi:hypothetical protein
MDRKLSIPDLPPTDPLPLVQISSLPTLDSPRPSASPITAPSPARSLRHRLSNSATTSSPGARTPNTPPSSIRKPSSKELAQIEKKLGPGGVVTRRDELIGIKEAELKGIVEGHDLAVREKFHLERFISLLENYDSDVSPKEEHILRLIG